MGCEPMNPWTNVRTDWLRRAGIACWIPACWLTPVGRVLHAPNFTTKLDKNMAQVSSPTFEIRSAQVVKRGALL